MVNARKPLSIGYNPDRLKGASSQVFSQNSIHVEKKQRGSDVCALKVHIINTNPYVGINPHTH